MKAYPSIMVGQNHPSRKREAHKFLSWLYAHKDRWRDTSVLHLEHEPSNRFDSNAIAVWDASPNGHCIGYLPKGCWAGEAISEGRDVLAVIKNIERTGLFSKKYLVTLELLPTRRSR